MAVQVKLKTAIVIQICFGEIIIKFRKFFFFSFHKVDWKQAAKRNAEVVALTDEMELCIPDTSRDREMEAKEIGKALNDFLESLPKETRLIFLRRYWHVDTIAEIAARYGITESKVKMQLSRTRAKLCTYLEQEGIQV